MAVYFGGCCGDVNNRFVAILVPVLRAVLHIVVADRDYQITLI